MDDAITVLKTGITMTAGASSVGVAIPTDSSGNLPRYIRLASTQPIYSKIGAGAVALTTPVNAAFATATTGGTLAAATYYYRVSAINALGETLASTETSIATTGTTSTVTVNWGAVTGATGYKVYGRATGAELFLASVGSVTTWTDTGANTPSGALPTTNTTSGVTAVAGDMLVSPGDATVISTNNCNYVACLQAGTGGILQVSPLENS